MTVEDQEFNLVDIVKLAGGAKLAVTLDATLVVDDGFVSISLIAVKNDPKINGIEIKRSVPHIAHSVSNGPYRAVDINNNGFATIVLDGSESHTHGVDLSLKQWIWKKGSQIIGTGEVSSFTFPVGTHDISLTVTNDRNNESTEATTVTVHPYGFPDISAITPSSGSIMGGDRVFIVGSGFTYSPTRTIVYFGESTLTGADVTVHNSTTISVLSPHIPISIPVQVSVTTPLASSDAKLFTYTSSTPILFKTTKLMDITQPTSVEFGPDGKLYIGSLKGALAKVMLSPDFTSVVAVVSAIVQPDRAILGIAFDPLDAGIVNPPVYISSSFLFHGEAFSSSGTAINGKISRIHGANLDIVEDVITGLPVCDLDHGMSHSKSLGKAKQCLIFSVTSFTATQR
jgi:IPT/TIG domain